MEIKEISYKDERLGFFADQRKLVQKRYDRLEKQIKPDEPYMSERRQFLSDCGRELSFYNDVIEMLENDVVPKSEVKKIFKEFERLMENNEVWFRQTDEIREGFSKLKKKYTK